MPLQEYIFRSLIPESREYLEYFDMEILSCNALGEEFNYNKNE